MGQELSGGLCSRRQRGVPIRRTRAIRQGSGHERSRPRLEKDALGYFNLAGTYLSLNRLDDAQKAIAEAQAHKFEGDFLHLAMYLVAF